MIQTKIALSVNHFIEHSLKESRRTSPQFEHSFVLQKVNGIANMSPTI